MSQTIQRKMAHGAGWMVLFKLGDRTIGLASTLIIVRILSPADFGTLAMATSFIALAETMTAFGLDIALIQRQDATEEHYHAAWSVNVLFGLLIATLMLSLADSIAGFYRRPEVFGVVCALAVGPVLSGLENPGVVAFRKEMRFKGEFVFQLTRKLISFLVVVPFAFYFRSYWALVAGMLTGRLASVILSYLAHPFRPRFSLVKVRSLMAFSKWLMLNNLALYFKERSSDFVIGRFHGPANLGLYNVSSELVSMPSTELSAPINRALVPGFARIAHDPVALRAAYANAINIMAILTVPAAAGIFAVAPFLVPVILGDKWLEAVPLVEISTVHGLFLLLHSSVSGVVIANGHPDRAFKANAFYVVLLLILFGSIVPGYGVTGAAYALLTASLLTTPIYLIQVRESIGVRPWAFAQAAARPIVAAVVMATVVRLILPDWSVALNFNTSLTWLTVGIVLGIVVYAATTLLLWFGNGCPESAERELLNQLRHWVALRRTTPIPSDRP